LSTNIVFPQSAIVGPDGRLAREWVEWLQNPQILTLVLENALGVTSGGTGLTSGTSGGVLAFTDTDTMESSALLAEHAIVVGGGAGEVPYTIGVGTATTVLHGSASGDPTFGAVSLTTDVSGILPPANGGTGVANTSTLTLAGGFALTFTLGAGTSLTLPASGTVLSTAAAVTVAQGGTGVTTLTGIPLGAGTSAFTALDYVPWTTPAFDAGNFSGGGSMTWTVESGDVVTYAYTIVGKTMTLAFSLDTTTVGGTPSDELLITIPASKTATKTIYAAAFISDDGSRSIGVCRSVASRTTIGVLLASAGNFTASTDNTIIRGEITFQIN
jgi:hypothetical protein